MRSVPARRPGVHQGAGAGGHGLGARQRPELRMAAPRRRGTVVRAGGRSTAEASPETNVRAGGRSTAEASPETNVRAGGRSTAEASPETNERAAGRSAAEASPTTKEERAPAGGEPRGTARAGRRPPP